MKQTGATFRFDEHTVIALPAQPAPEDVKLATLLMRDLSDRCGIALQAVRVPAVPGEGRAIVLGSMRNPLVKTEASREELSVTEASPGPEGYALRVTERRIVVAGSDEAGAFYGVQSLRQLIRLDGTNGYATGTDIRDWPVKTFRGIKLFLPGRDNLAFFRRFITDFMSLYKFNKLVLEVNAGMRLERHPELNAGELDFARDLDLTRRDRPKGPRGELQDSAHHDTADRAVLEKDEVAAIVLLASDNHIEVIPEIPSLTHSYYLLARHRELAEVPTAEWPDTYCPSNPKVYPLLFDVLDEYIQVMQPKMVHIGHDEWRTPIDLCPLCKGKDHTELFLADLNKIHDYLAAKHIRTAIWGDHLIEGLRGKGTRAAGRAPNTYTVPGAVSDQQVRSSIPKDILIFNWFWGEGRGSGEVDDIALANWGFEQVYGNFGPGMKNYDVRRARKGVLGGAASCWSATTELNISKDALYDFIGIAPMLWSTQQLPGPELLRNVQSMMPDVRRRLSGQEPSSRFGDPIRTIEVAKTGAASVPIGEDATSLTFVHAAAKPGARSETAKVIYNAADTAELIGAYEVVYADGLIVSVPVRYAWNILARNWPAESGRRDYCCEAEARASDGGTVFAYEWPNPRLGRVIKEVRLRSFVESNPVTLEKIEVLSKRGH
jgi:hypothetical protein